MLYMVNHGLATGALFLVVGFLVSRRGSEIGDFGGVHNLHRGSPAPSVRRPVQPRAARHRASSASSWS